MPQNADVTPGARTILNPLTGQRIEILRSAAESNGSVLEMRSTYSRSEEPPPPHLHPLQEERLEVLEGRLRVLVDGREQVLGRGESIVIPAGRPHSASNGHDSETVIRWDVRPALETEQFFRVMWGLAAAGKTNGKGVPSPLRAAVVLRRFDDEFRLASPPRPIQVVVFGLLAAVGRVAGLRADVPDGDRPGQRG